MKRIRNIYSPITRIFCFSLALYFFNFSVDSRDAAPDFIPEDLSFNDIESIAEFFAEEVFDFQNAFEEHDERDGEDGGMFDFDKAFYCANAHIVTVDVPCVFPSRDKFHTVDPIFLPSPTGDVTSPPPKA